MNKTAIETILAVVRELEEKQKLADEMASLVTKIQESTDLDGNVEILITRTNDRVSFPANDLIQTITGRKNKAETDRDVIANKITIRNG